MKHTWTVLLITAALLAGCGKKEEPAAIASSEAPAAPTAPAAPAPKETTDAKPAAELASSLAAQAEETVKAVMPEVKEAAKAVASSVDWANLSWNDVSSVPYNDKDKLVAWASPQIEALKDQLTKAVMDKGMTGLASLGDSGWQGALKKTVDALNTIRTSSPETWQMATGALTTAWQALQFEAKKYLQ